MAIVLFQRAGKTKIPGMDRSHENKFGLPFVYAGGGVMTIAQTDDSGAAFPDRLVAIAPRLRRFCHGLCSDRDRGDDLLQATIERALARQSQWQEGTSLGNWLMRIASNLNIDRLRKDRSRGISVELDALDEAPGDDALSLLEFRSELSAVSAALSVMPAELNAVLACVVLDDRSYREAAEILDIPIGTVMSRMSRARQFVDLYVRRGPERIAAA